MTSPPKTTETPTTPISETVEPMDPLAEMTDLLKRTQANFENYRKQMEKRIEDLKETAGKEIIMQILPVLDNFELALKSIPHELSTDFIRGIELIHAQLLDLLNNNGVVPFDSVGAKFDPRSHEALMKVDSEQPEGIILEEFQKGYTLHGTVIRHARVKMSSGKSIQEESRISKTTKTNQHNGGN